MVLILISYFGLYLIQSGLGHRVILHAQPLLMAGEVAEDVGQSSRCVWELIFQCVVMLLRQGASREGQLDKVLNWLQVRRRATNSYNHCVAIPKPTTRDHN